MTLDAHGDSSAVFIFQAGTTLTTGSGSTVKLTGGAQECNVFWQVGSSATVGTNTTFVGNILALTSVALQNKATVAGRVLARNAAVTLDTNVISRPQCNTTTPRPSSTSSATSTPPASHSTVPSASSNPGEVIPSGHPGTGAGGAAVSGHGDTTLMVLGGTALVGAGAATFIAVLRRRQNGFGHSIPAGTE